MNTDSFTLRPWYNSYYITEDKTQTLPTLHRISFHFIFFLFLLSISALISYIIKMEMTGFYSLLLKESSQSVSSTEVSLGKSTFFSTIFVFSLPALICLTLLAKRGLIYPYRFLDRWYVPRLGLLLLALIFLVLATFRSLENTLIFNFLNRTSDLDSISPDSQELTNLLGELFGQAFIPKEPQNFFQVLFIHPLNLLLWGAFGATLALTFFRKPYVKLGEGALYSHSEATLRGSVLSSLLSGALIAIAYAHLCKYLLNTMLFDMGKIMEVNAVISSNPSFISFLPVGLGLLIPTLIYSVLPLILLLIAHRLQGRSSWLPYTVACPWFSGIPIKSTSWTFTLSLFIVITLVLLFAEYSLPHLIIKLITTAPNNLSSNSTMLLVNDLSLTALNRFIPVVLFIPWVLSGWRIVFTLMEHCFLFLQKTKV